MHVRVSFLAVIVLALFSSFPLLAKEVTLQHKGMTLNADLTLADGKSLSKDGVILITHGALAHRDMETIRYFRKLLNGSGHNTLAINLSLGLDNRHGMYDCKTPHRHRNEDAAEEIGAWVSWLKQQGASQVILMGHSRGGAQTALYGIDPDAIVNAVVLLAPATSDDVDADGFKKRYHQELAPLLDKAKQLVAQGKGSTLLSHAFMMYCRDTAVSAESFLSYYGPSALVQTPKLLPSIKLPTLVVVAGNDEVVVGLDRKISKLVDGKHLQMQVIDGSNHMFRDLYADDAVDVINDFLGQPD